MLDAGQDGGQHPLRDDRAHDGRRGEHLGAGLRQPRQPSFHGVADARGKGPGDLPRHPQARQLGDEERVAAGAPPDPVDVHVALLTPEQRDQPARLARVEPRQ